MFNYLYVSTLDRKKNTHQYKLPAGEAAPTGHEITDLRLAGVYPIADILPLDQIALLAVAFPQPKNQRRKPTRKPKAGNASA